MLSGLRLQNIALIDSLELEFDHGFTVLTGETGAGKSILLDALDALLGGLPGSAGTKLLRTGVDRAQIEAVFKINACIHEWLCEQSFDLEESELVISREWRRQDDRFTSRTRVAGVVVNRQQILALRPLLIDLTVQGQTQQLGRPGQQRRWLDQLGGSAAAAALDQVRQAWRHWQQASEALAEARATADRDQQQRQQDEALLAELEQVRLEDPHEDRLLEIEQDRLVHGVRLQEGLSLLLGRLQEGEDQAPSVLDHLGACNQELQALVQLDPSLQSQRHQGLDLEVALQDMVRQLESYGACLESDPEQLAQLQDRLAMLKRLQRRHEADLSQLLDRIEALRERLAPGSQESLLDQLQKQEQQARQRRDRNNQLLSTLRQKTAAQLEESLTEQLRPMGLLDVRFEVKLTSSVADEKGADAVSFLFSANPGQPMAPLAEVASGGEMSRFLLALKTALAEVDGSSTLLFDEIDAGVSGRVSGAMAGLLKAMAAHRQVFCVTHQPLVAAVADHHFRVSKSVEQGMTHSRVSHLRDTQARQQELAELAGGEIGEARAYAASLLVQHVA